MKIADFAEKHGVSRESIYMGIRHNNIKLISSANRNAEIDENFFTRRHAFRERVINYNHDMFFFLNEYFSTTEISTQFKPDNIQSASTWLGNGMFARKEYSIMSYKIQSYHWEFFRFSRKVHRNLERVMGYKIDIGYLLDRMSEKHEREIGCMK